MRGERLRPGLDDALAALRDDAPDRDLSQIELEVWRRVGAARRDRGLELRVAPFRIAAVLMALGLGTLAGVAQVRDVRTGDEVSAFRVATELAPSTLLDGRS